MSKEAIAMIHIPCVSASKLLMNASVTGFRDGSRAVGCNSLDKRGTCEGKYKCPQLFPTSSQTSLEVPGVSLELCASTLKIGKVTLSSQQTKLFEFLVSREGEVVSKQEIADVLGTDISGNKIEVLVSRLRKKVERNRPKDLPYFIGTVRGKGYRLNNLEGIQIEKTNC